nr:DUF5806 family protein [Halovivax gelatinilyticus]
MKDRTQSDDRESDRTSGDEADGSEGRTPSGGRTRGESGSDTAEEPTPVDSGPGERSTDGADADASPSDASNADDDGAREEGDDPASTSTDASRSGDDGPATESESDSNASDTPMPGVPDPDKTVPEDVRKYERFKKMDGAQYERVNEFLRDRTYITAREWAIARLCADFRTETGVEMTKIGENLPSLVPFMTDTYTPQAVNQARSSFDDKVRKAGATFLYGAMCDFYAAEELDDVMYEVTEVSKFLLEVEGVDLAVEDELEAEERISSVMREVREASKALREEETLLEADASDDESVDGTDDSDEGREDGPDAGDDESVDERTDVDESSDGEPPVDDSDADTADTADELDDGETADDRDDDGESTAEPESSP